MGTVREKEKHSQRTETAPGWKNWSGSLRFTPGESACPESEGALAALVRQGAAEGRTVRVVGTGHSSTPLVETGDVLVSLDDFTGLEAADPERNVATLRPGSSLNEAVDLLQEQGMTFPNLGDVDAQTVAGALGTGTHGSGRNLQNLSALLVGVRLVNGQGQIVSYNLEEDPEVIHAARVSLGALGIFTALRLQLVPSFTLRRHEWCTDTPSCLAHLDELIAQNRNFDFYWYPRSDEVKLRTMNRPGEEPADLPYARCVEEQEGLAGKIIPQAAHLDLKFDEMEYALPAEAGPACFREVRKRIKEKYRKEAGWRLLYRTVAPDGAFLSNAYGRQTVTISLHQNAGLPFWDYFRGIEPIFRAYGGRPHWAKKHTLKADELRPLYPAWDRFLAVRERLDPEGVFLNPYLEALLGVCRP